jgi:pimeloyl-ACP methyl ester carboxylesterase
MPQHKLAYKHSIINYYVYGSGTKILFFLHGYGENGSSFELLEKHLGTDYTIYAIDFPFHGETQWNEQEAFTVDDLLFVFHSINSKEDVPFSMLAYSMGGRAAMHFLQQGSEKIERVVLVAPDGMHINFWYWLATQTSAGNKLFHVTMNNPRWFFQFLDTAGKLRILNKSIIKFVHYFLDNKEERILLYRRWTVMRKFKPDLNYIRKICSENNILLYLVFGSYDRIILSKRANALKHEKNIQIKIIEAGHQLLKEKYAAEIAALLYH